MNQDDVNMLRVLLDQVADELSWEETVWRPCEHRSEQWKYNNGDPWVICQDCRVKLRNA